MYLPGRSRDTPATHFEPRTLAFFDLTLDFCNMMVG